MKPTLPSILLRFASHRALLLVVASTASCGLFEGQSPDLFPDAPAIDPCPGSADCPDTEPGPCADGACEHCSSDTGCVTSPDLPVSEPEPIVSHPEATPLEPQPNDDLDDTTSDALSGSTPPDSDDPMTDDPTVDGVPDDGTPPDESTSPEPPSAPPGQPVAPLGLDAGVDDGGGRPRPPRPPRR